jgi:hypothetical protein
LVEYGAVGLLLMLAMLAIFLAAWWRRGGHRDAFALFLAAGVGGLLLHAFFDYVLRNPALLILGVGVAFAGLRWAGDDGVTPPGSAAPDRK